MDILQANDQVIVESKKNKQHFTDKVVSSLSEAIRLSGLKDGMTISFHHHFREGDRILNQVMAKIDEAGIKNLTLSSSSLNEVHAPLIDLIEKKVITKIETSGLRGALAEAISHGIMDEPVLIRSHGGRARAIENQETKINVAFLGVSCSDCCGNANGRYGKAACGSLGYALVDAQAADVVILITDTLVPYPNLPRSIDQSCVDMVVVLDEIGDPQGIVSGATRYTIDPKELLIAQACREVITQSPHYHQGFSIQAGSGGASLAVARFLKASMLRDHIKASFGLGGITGQFAELLKQELIDVLFDVQDFDLQAVESLKTQDRHLEISASQYANPANKGALVNNLDVVILSALEIDVHFNVNVLTGFDGCLRGASGGHCDAAEGAKCAIIVAPLVRGRIPTVVDHVHTIITPGKSIDVVVTERGVAVNPLRQDLLACFKNNPKIPLCSIEELRDRAYAITGRPLPLQTTDKPVAIVEYRDGTPLDVVYQVKADE